MKSKQVIVYIEGEGGGRGSRRRYNDGEFRKSWKQFLQPLADTARNNGVDFFRCVPGRGGTMTTETFSKPLPKDEGALRILLIDSEAPVADINKPWDALGVKAPDWADEKNCYLMVQCLETWLLADVDSLKAHYDKSKSCFDEKKIKAWQNLEGTERKTLQDALVKATANCLNPYEHADGNLIIAVVDRDKLKALSSVERLFKEFEEKIKEYAQPAPKK